MTWPHELTLTLVLAKLFPTIMKNYFCPTLPSKYAVLYDPDIHYTVLYFIVHSSGELQCGELRPDPSHHCFYNSSYQL